MSQEAILLAIREEPEEDGHRLVLADWLEEHGDPDRAEFIRLQVYRARAEAPVLALDHADALVKPLEREALLLAAHQAEWAGLAPEGIDIEFHRGLLAVRVDGERTRAFLEGKVGHLDRLFRAGWVEQLHLAVDREDMPALAACPHLACVSSLFLQGHSCGPEGAARLADSPHLERLNCLDLTCTFIGDEGAARLASSPHLAQLRRLRLRENSIGPAGAEALVSSPFLGRLTHLELEDNPLRDEGASAVASSLRLGELRFLDLSWSMIGQAGAEALASSPALDALTGLDLSVNALGPAGVRALVSSPQLAGLTHLDLSATFCADPDSAEPQRQAEEAARGLAEGLRLRRLSFLNLSHNGLRAAEMVALAASSSLASLKLLGLAADNYSEPPGEEGARALARSPLLAGLTHLELHDCRVEDAGAAALACSPNLASLRYLGLGGNLVGDAGASALAASPHFSNLEMLALTRNPLSNRCPRELLDSPQLPRLEWLYLSEAQDACADRAALRRRYSSSEEVPWRPTPGAVAALAAAVADPDPACRSRAVQQLEKLLGDSRLHAEAEEHLGRQVVSRALRDPDAEVRLCATRALLAITPTEDLLPALRPLVHDESQDVRLLAAQTLDRFGEPSHLVGLLHDPDEGVRLTALRSLRQCGEVPAETVGALRQCLGAQDGLLRLESALALLAAGRADHEAEVVLRAALLQGERQTASRIAEALAEAAPSWPQAVEVLRSGLASADSGIRLDVVRALTAAGKAGCEVWPILAGVLANPQDELRGEAVSALEELGPPAAAAVPALLEAAREPSLRMKALRAVVRIGGESAVALIEEPGDPAEQLLILGLRYQAGGACADSVRAQLRPDVLAAVARAGKIEAIRHFRTALGIGLKDARDLVEAVLREAPTAEG